MQRWCAKSKTKTNHPYDWTNGDLRKIVGKLIVKTKAFSKNCC